MLYGYDWGPRPYQAVIQAILLFGSETWVTTPSMMKVLNGFHIRAAYRMSKLYKPKENDDGTWTYPATKDVLEELGLETIDHYIEKRRNSIAEYVATRPIFETCQEESIRPGTSHHKRFWWDQPLNLDPFEDMED